MWRHPKVPDLCKSTIQCSNSNGVVEVEQWLTASLIVGSLLIDAQFPNLDKLHSCKGLQTEE